MSREQASARDRQAQKWKFNRLWKKVSSVFKGCDYCGEWEMRTTRFGKEYKHWTIPGEVYQSMRVEQTKFEYWCYVCGAKDEAAWAPREEREVVVRQTPIQMSSAAKLELLGTLEKELAEMMRLLKK